MRGEDTMGTRASMNPRREKRDPVEQEGEEGGGVWDGGLREEAEWKVVGEEGGSEGV